MPWAQKYTMLHIESASKTNIRVVCDDINPLYKLISTEIHHKSGYRLASIGCMKCGNKFQNHIKICKCSSKIEWMILKSIGLSVVDQQNPLKIIFAHSLRTFGRWLAADRRCESEAFRKISCSSCSLHLTCSSFIIYIDRRACARFLLLLLFA